MVLHYGHDRTSVGCFNWADISLAGAARPMAVYGFDGADLSNSGDYDFGAGAS